MTQESLNFAVEGVARSRPAAPRKNRAERVIAMIQKQPYGWYHARAFEPIGGRQAWRTAISEARTILEASGRGTIENRVYRRRGSGEVVSEYRFVPRQT